jgi:cytochrome c biogenesis protein CcdA
MPFYSYFILIRLLDRQSLVVFKSVFWAIMAILLVIRMMILTSRAKDIIAGNIDRQNFIDNLHIGYFTSIALVECIGAFFLLRKFASAQRGSTEASSTSGLFQYLMRSTGFRITVLAMIGFSRAITHSFYTTAQSATNVATQTDRFVYSLECLFPTIM